MSRFTLLAVASTCFVACLLPDFEVVPAASTATDGGPDPTTPDGSQTGDSSPGTDGSTPDGGLVCMAGFGDCDDNAANGCETDLKASAEHCGACKRACGGTSSCENSDCKAETIVAGLAQPFGLELAGLRMVWHESDTIHGCRISDCSSSKAIMVEVSGGTNFPDGAFSPNHIAVDGDKFFFSQCPSGQNTDCSPAACDIAGCKLTGATYLMPAGQGYRRAQFITKKPGSVVAFHALDGLYRVPSAGGAQVYESQLYGVQDSLQAIEFTATDAVILDPDTSIANPIGGLFTCAATGCVGAKKRILPPPVRYLALAAGNAYTSSGTQATASIIECAIAGCQSAGTPIATNQAYVSDIAADDKAVYWLTVGAQNAITNSAAVGALMMCPLPGCVGGPKKLAENLLNPSRVRIDPTYVYWVERGASAMPNGKIWRKRR